MLSSTSEHFANHFFNPLLWHSNARGVWNYFAQTDKESQSDSWSVDLHLIYFQLWILSTPCLDWLRVLWKLHLVGHARKFGFFCVKNRHVPIVLITMISTSNLAPGSPKRHNNESPKGLEMTKGLIFVVDRLNICSLRCCSYQSKELVNFEKNASEGQNILRVCYINFAPKE